MSVFFDSDVLISALTSDSDRSPTAIQALNSASDPHTSICNIMELRSVLSKKKGFEREHFERIEKRVARKMTIRFPDAADIIAANELQSKTLLYPMDAIILSTAEAADCQLVTFDSELHEAGAIPPEEVLESA